VNIDAYALGQSVLNVALIVCILRLKMRTGQVARHHDFQTDWLVQLDQRVQELERKESAK
jgi:hypothetical protein